MQFRKPLFGFFEGHIDIYFQPAAARQPIVYLLHRVVYAAVVDDNDLRLGNLTSIYILGKCQHRRDAAPIIIIADRRHSQQPREADVQGLRNLNFDRLLE